MTVFEVHFVVEYVTLLTNKILIFCPALAYINIILVFDPCIMHASRILTVRVTTVFFVKGGPGGDFPDKYHKSVYRHNVFSEQKRAGAARGGGGV